MLRVGTSAGVHHNKRLCVFARFCGNPEEIRRAPDVFDVNCNAAGSLIVRQKIDEIFKAKIGFIPG
jgi:hypothetical protein